MKLTDLSWTADQLSKLAAQLRHAGYPEPASSIDFMTERMKNDEFNATLATVLRQTYTGNCAQMAESGVWSYVAGIARTFIDGEQFDLLDDIPSDRFFWSERIGPDVIYRFTHGHYRAIQARSWDRTGSRVWINASRGVVAGNAPFRLIPTSMVAASERAE
ncbi:hypothetical protein [Nocardia brasiliensis]|uniref:hypothetical protein n=1 Tax=Nocardia brasiliensis TaxID=37326 RepID=UPI002457BB01|nr:hypothetical protein [Nocardia brasiliensis]